MALCYALRLASLLLATTLARSETDGPICRLQRSCFESTGPVSALKVWGLCVESTIHPMVKDWGTCKRFNYICPLSLPPNDIRFSGMKQFGLPPCHGDTIAAVDRPMTPKPTPAMARTVDRPTIPKPSPVTARAVDRPTMPKPSPAMAWAVDPFTTTPSTIAAVDRLVTMAPPAPTAEPAPASPPAASASTVPAATTAPKPFWAGEANGKIHGFVMQNMFV